MNSSFAILTRLKASLAAATIALLLIASPVFGQDETTNAEPQAADAQDTANQQTVRRLLAIRQALEDRRERIRELIDQLDSAEESAVPAIRRQIAAQREVIRDLTNSFENIAANGAVLRDSETDVDRPLDWNEELSQIVRPLISGLKDATEKPRRIAELRTAIDVYERQLEVARRATESLAQFDRDSMPAEVAEGLDAVGASWRDRSQDIERSLEDARIELNNLEVQDTEIFEAIGSSIGDFLLGSGLTLLLALVLALLISFVMRSLQRLIKKWRRNVDDSAYAARIRVLLYSYNLLTMFLVTMAVLSVFYARGDFLLLSLAIIGLAMLLLGIWRFLPGYIEEVRLLLNLGAAREGERVIYNGLPFRIASLNLYSELRNPELEGVIRLPLSALAQLNSRNHQAEPWFPSRVGEYLLLPDGGFAQVIRQTVELTQLKVVGAIVQLASADFLQLGARNLSRDGFGVVVGFGIDYAHQPIALDQVPERFREGIRQALDAAGYGDDLKDLVVDFKEAAASSLDYLVYASLDGSRAGSYFSIARLLQQACVEVCNREDWGIPFTQVTLHAADGGALKLPGEAEG